AANWLRRLAKSAALRSCNPFNKLLKSGGVVPVVPPPVTPPPVVPPPVTPPPVVPPPVVPVVGSVLPFPPLSKGPRLPSSPPPVFPPLAPPFPGVGLVEGPGAVASLHTLVPACIAVIAAVVLSTMPLVEGSNKALSSVKASLRNWPSLPLPQRIEAMLFNAAT